MSAIIFFVMVVDWGQATIYRIININPVIKLIPVTYNSKPRIYGIFLATF